MPWAARDYVSLASQNSRTNARDGYTDVKKEPRGIAGNEYLCNKDSKKSLHFLLSKERIKTVLSKHLYHPHLLLHTLRIAIKSTPADIPHRTVTPLPPSRTTGKPVSRQRKGSSATRQTLSCNAKTHTPLTVNTLPKPRKTRVFVSAVSLRRKYPTLAELPMDKYAPPSAPLHFYAKLGARNTKASPY